MGKAALDLPDPLKHGGKPAGKSSGGLGAPNDIGLGATDDLLSQLAGNEIDRLLAEAEVEGSSPTEVSDVESAQAPMAETEIAAEAAQIEKVSEVANAEVAGIEDEVAPAAAEVPSEEPLAQEVDLDASPVDTAQGEVGAELDELFAALKDPTLKFAEVGEPEPEPDVEPEPVAIEATPVEEVAAPITEKTQAVLAEAMKTEDSSAAVAAELEADEKLHRGGKKVEASVAAPAAAAPSATAGVSGAVAAPSAMPALAHVPAPKAAPVASVPAWLRPLEMINAPFNSLPEAWRNALGQVAIVTMVNAVAVLLYVWIFRKH